VNHGVCGICGSGITVENGEVVGRDDADLLAALEHIVESFAAIRYKRQPVMTPRQRELVLEADKAILVDGRAAIAKASGTEVPA
jgi:hypothetical protein